MRNSIWIGVGLGAVFPLIAFALTTYSDWPARIFPTKPFAFYVISAAINLLLIRVFYRKAVPYDQVAKGIILTTFLGMLLFLYFFKLRM
ncbi:hypothetical protein [Sphingobacterium deserti]|uniref:Integral membrane protein n=1 Tax=Sphingobacterium deserti TaxID=1229276 RepID=A0A0B8T1D6_9SPHI|nr:hypothetical protein [Sphingobacterium deserti]KGE14692.1 hypothetical protein DI53_1721 [Sphingobacterium deserti]